MKKIQLSLVAGTLLLGTALPSASFAQVRHKKLKTVVAGVGAYELAKHSHNRFLKKHKFAAGVVGAAVAHHYMKKKTH